MTFITPINVLRIQEELKEYKKLCQQFEYSPAKKEFEDIVQFILLHSGDGINESVNESSMDYLYESFIDRLDLQEGHIETDGEAEWDTAAGAAIGTGKKLVTGLAVGAALTGLYIAFLMKRGKLKSSIGKELSLEQKKLDKFGELAKLKVDYANKTGKELPEMSSKIPTMTEGPELEKPSKPGDKE